ncbi:hypothetical protein QDR37_11275 [Amnibacterium sp. CER49]|uniref:hypothetical protein n=1 Tax=Amnibacterium sp. CER49 TaxID=3039161 RepID=UPI00244A1064|nr:hypothetical protein [Amnibacterium sp. CER49]MDH2444526.1 hypothetical protein [Amnibacterium sp. CER49]
MAALAGAVLVPMAAQALGQYPTGHSGIDLSFPSCANAVPSGEFRIVGVQGGSDFTDNGCANAEATVGGFDPANVSIYVNTGYNTANPNYKLAQANCPVGEASCAAYQYGYLAGIYAYDTSATKANLLNAQTWWLDVETTNPWSTNTALNVQDIQGEYDAISGRLKNAGSTATVGVYARPAQWATITGTGLGTSGWPVWYATGARNQTTSQLQQACKATSFTGGPIQVVQWIGQGHLNDLDYGC